MVTDNLTIKVIDNKYYELKHPFYHKLSFESLNRSFVYFIDIKTNKKYIEEIINGQLTYIDNDDLAKLLESFLITEGLL